MRKIDIMLSHDQENLYDFRLFQYLGSQIAVRQFSENTTLDYDEDHITRIMNAFHNNYKAIQSYVKNLIEEETEQIVDMKYINYNKFQGLIRVFINE